MVNLITKLKSCFVIVSDQHGEVRAYSLQFSAFSTFSTFSTCRKQVFKVSASLRALSGLALFLSTSLCESRRTAGYAPSRTAEWYCCPAIFGVNVFIANKHNCVLQLRVNSICVNRRPSVDRVRQGVRFICGLIWQTLLHSPIAAARIRPALVFRKSVSPQPKHCPNQYISSFFVFAINAIRLAVLSVPARQCETSGIRFYVFHAFRLSCNCSSLNCMRSFAYSKCKFWHLLCHNHIACEFGRLSGARLGGEYRRSLSVSPNLFRLMNSAIKFHF